MILDTRYTHMTPDKWQNIKGMVKDKFEVLEEFSEELTESPGTIEGIVFIGPVGKMKLEFITRPVVLDKKTIHSGKRIGGMVKVDYVYSDDEMTHSFKAYKWDDSDEEWVEMEAEKLAFEARI